MIFQRFILLNTFHCICLSFHQMWILSSYVKRFDRTCNKPIAWKSKRVLKIYHEWPTYAISNSQLFLTVTDHRWCTRPFSSRVKLNSSNPHKQRRISPMWSPVFRFSSADINYLSLRSHKAGIANTGHSDQVMYKWYHANYNDGKGQAISRSFVSSCDVIHKQSTLQVSLWLIVWFSLYNVP